MSGGTINTAANLMMVLCPVVLKVLNRKETQVFNNFKILELLIIVLLED